MAAEIMAAPPGSLAAGPAAPPQKRPEFYPHHAFLKLSTMASARYRVLEEDRPAREMQPSKVM